MTTATCPWLWVYGPCGAGKTAVGYELFTQLVADGYRMGYIEIDQLGMCLPVDDASRARIKVANLLSALGSFSDADVDGLIVSGDIVVVAPALAPESLGSGNAPGSQRSNDGGRGPRDPGLHREGVGRAA